MRVKVGEPRRDRDEPNDDGRTTVFPVVRNAQGGPSPDGRALLVEGLTAEGGVVRFALSLAEVQHFIAFLLVSVGKISATRPDQGAAQLDTANCRPIPATSIAIGEPQGSGFSVWDSSFSMPPAPRFMSRNGGS